MTIKWKIVIIISTGEMVAQIVDNAWLTSNQYSLFNGTDVWLPSGAYGKVLKMERVLDADITEP